MKSVALVGWNGKMNAGDDAMTMVIVNYLIGKYGKDTSIRLLADHAALATYTNDNNRGIRGFVGYNQIAHLPFIRRYALSYWYPSKLVKNKDLLLFGGGSLFHSRGTLQKYTAIVSSFRQANPEKKAGALGVSIGPFKDASTEVQAKKLISTFDFIVVRDLRSYELLKQWALKIPFKYAPDLALLATPKAINKKPDEKNGMTIGISLRHGHSSDERLALILNCLALIRESGRKIKKIKLFVFCRLAHDNDADTNAQLKSKMSEALRALCVEIDYSNKPIVFYKEVQSCDLMLCIRLHSAIFAYATQTPFLILPYHQKCIDFCKDVAEMEDKLLLTENMPNELLKSRLEMVLSKEEELFYNWNKAIELANQNFAFLA